MAYSLTIPGELSSYLNIAYSLCYKYQPINEDFFTRIFIVTKRMFTLIKELVWDNTSEDRLQKNATQLKTDFENKNKSYSGDEKPLCVYFVNDETIQNNNLKTSSYYYHHYKIQELEKHFTVVPELFSSQDQMKTAMKDLQTKYSNKKIQFINIYTHSNKSTLITSAVNDNITTENFDKDLFAACASDATILLEGPYTGSGTTNIADEIARKNPGRTILAPNSATYFSKPIIEGTGKEPKVVSTIDPFAILNPYKYKSFSYIDLENSNYPYSDYATLHKDLKNICDQIPMFFNSWLDQFLKRTEMKNIVRDRLIENYNALSPQFKNLILIKIQSFKNLDLTGCEKFLFDNPLHPKVLSAFRAVVHETFQELREVPDFRSMKMSAVYKSAYMFPLAYLYIFAMDIKSLSNTLFMIPREIPNYLKTAYSIRYENQPNIGNSLEQIVTATKRMFTLIQEITYPTEQNRFTKKQLDDKFKLINESKNQSTNQKPLCVYFVQNSSWFHPNFYYYHLYKIQELQKHFTVAPSLVSSQEEISNFMKLLNKPIQFVNIASYGEKSKFLYNYERHQYLDVTNLKKDLFEGTAPDATILLEGQYTGLGNQNIANQIANNTPGRTVLAPATITMGYSKPIIETTKEGAKVVSAVYGNTMLNAGRSKPFRYTQTRSLEYPYPLDPWHMFKDLQNLTYNPLIRNHWLDPLTNQDEYEKFLSIKITNETKNLFNKKYNETLGSNEKIKTISAWREVAQELEEELCELPFFNIYKLRDVLMTVTDLAKAYFHTLTKKQST